MKKSLKILTLVLSLALICGALVVAAFAGDTEVAGIKVVKSTDFSGASLVTNKNNQVDIAPGFLWNNVAGMGTISIEEKNGNNFFQWTGALKEGQTVGNAYVSSTITSGDVKKYNTTDGTHTQPGTLDVYDHVVEVDIFTPTGSYESNTNSFIKVMVFGWGPDFASGSRFSFCGNLNVEPIIKTKDGVSTLSWKGESVTLEPDSWSHITIAVTSDRISDSVNGDYLSFNAAIWVNDTLAIYKQGYGTTLDPKVGTTSKGYDQLTSYVIGEVRLQPQGSNAKNITADMSYAIDNVVVQQITKEEYKAAGGNLYDVIAEGGNISEWDSNNYDRTKTPYGNTVVVNTTTGVEYDNLQYAIDCADLLDELELRANVLNGVIVDKDLYIAKNGFGITAGVLEGAKGYAVNETDEGWQIEESDSAVEIEWGLCTCGLDICDETHPGDIVTEVNVGGNIFKSYEKDMNWSYVSEDGMTIIKLVGWEDEEGNVYTSDSIMTAELAEECGGYLILNPILTVETPAYKYVSGGKETYGMADKMTLAQVISAADKDTTVTILSDLAFKDGVATISKNLTIDFNGCTIVSFTTSTKANLFSVYNADVTFKTSKEGAVIIHGHDTGSTKEKEAFQGLAVFGGTGANSIIRINGEGLTTYSTVVCHTQTGGCQNGGFYIDGGTYIQPVSIGDNGGMFQLSTLKFFEMKNATVHGATRKAFAFWGNHFAATPEEKVVVTIDNCVILNATVADQSFDMLDVTITNTVIGGNINISACQGKSSWYTSRENVPGGTWTIGEGCTIKSGATIQATLQDATLKYADGYVAENYDATETYTVRYNTFTTGDLAASKVLGDPTEITVNLAKKVVKYVAPISVNWVDANGALIGTTTATPGYVATAPTVAVEGNSWVMAQYTTWTNHAGVVGEALLPEDATDGYTFKLVEGSDATYVAGKVPVYINYDLVLHFQVNIYVPADAPEGVSNVAYVRNDGKARAFSNTNYMTINGEKVLNGAEWPGIFGVDDHVSIVAVTFEYEGQTITYEVPSFNMGEYAKAVFNGEYSTEMKQAVLSTLNYVKAAHAYTNGQTLNASLTEAIALAAELGITVENATVDTTVTGDLTALAQYVKSAQITIQGGGVTLQLSKADSAIGQDATAYFNGTANLSQWQKSPGAIGDNTWYWTNTRAYEFDEVVIIEIRNAAGDVLASGEYSALIYAAAIWEDANQQTKDLIVATLTMAKYVEPIKNYNK